MQSTLGRSLEVYGLGLHSGQEVHVCLSPADPGTGRLFIVKGTSIPATAEHVIDTRLATTLGRNGAKVSMVEHLCAALYASHVDNVVIEVHGGEVPVLDGSARLWLEAIHSAGVVPQGRPRPSLKLDHPVVVQQDGGWIRLDPEEGLHLDVGIHFDHPVIGQQRWSGPVDPLTFRRELAWARTFGFLKDAERLRASGLARGASLENTVVYDEAGVVNPDGLRAPDEAIRHKALDAVGDLSLLGIPVHGRLSAWRAGHHLHYALVRELHRIR